MPDIETLLKSRISTNKYDSARSLTDQQIDELIQLATTAPSAFNLQNWKFVAVRSAVGKAKLLPLAYGQQKVVDAAVTFIVCGTLEPQLTLPAALKPSVERGILDQGIYEGWVGAANSMYGDNPAFQRDEAVRSASLAAMTLMIAAEDRGLASGPMIGFDPAAVAAAFGLKSTDVPVMLVTVGYAAPGNWPQKPRKSTSDVLTFA
ncbi:nitroreductase family protein [Burkholderia cenocepacia]|jgi:nitroreductase|uniref:nitroreductase family protein n=1 Tax=Burkholderia cenocepacia TaxID=95486 RepID=UPI0004F744BF|nr:nitroreductase family protein [Burkholderia cenocepacia]AIO43125.1 nitroreductase family protein [Burkholderia cepacia]KGC05405.1 nitroreductase family protein [Burkholderia cepacia]MCG0579565.1 nitroreductase family protein [Burkholderia cenocepacia]MCW3525494.1 nitroreductase family protein [Burkholderia cenocepacia]MCW3615674.1 nitroreductase family protein [Burkholderia cenocepacia]